MYLLLALSGCTSDLPAPPSPEDYLGAQLGGGAEDGTAGGTSEDGSGTGGGTGGGDTGGGDTGGGDTGGAAPPDWALLSSVPNDRGFTWERDQDFILDDRSVPTVAMMAPGDFRMYATDMGDMGRIYQWRSPDGLSWVQDAEPLFTVDMFAEDCGDDFLDTAVIYLPDGRVRIMLEGFNLSGTIRDDEDVSTICSAVTADGEDWTLEGPGEVFQADEQEAGWSSVLEVTWYPAGGQYLMYYVGGGFGTAWDGTIHLATSSDGEHFTSDPEDWMISELGDVDPSPVWEEEGSGLRLYHTRDHPGGKLGLMRSEDGRRFEDMGFLPELDAPDCGWEGTQVIDESASCPMDPFFIHLPSGELVLYYTVHEMVDGQTKARIARAFATD